jgi:hypothetical protein
MILRMHRIMQHHRLAAPDLVIGGVLWLGCAAAQAVSVRRARRKPWSASEVAEIFDVGNLGQPGFNLIQARTE